MAAIDPTRSANASRRNVCNVAAVDVQISPMDGGDRPLPVVRAARGNVCIAVVATLLTGVPLTPHTFACGFGVVR